MDYFRTVLRYLEPRSGVLPNPSPGPHAPYLARVWLGVGPTPPGFARDQGCRDIFYISRYAIHRDIAIRTEIDGRIDGERRKYTKSHSAAATSVWPHTYIRIPLRCCVHLHIYCKLSAPIEIKISRPCKYLNV